MGRTAFPREYDCSLTIYAWQAHRSLTLTTQGVQALKKKIDRQMLQNFLRTAVKILATTTAQSLQPNCHAHASEYRCESFFCIFLTYVLKYISTQPGLFGGWKVKFGFQLLLTPQKSQRWSMKLVLRNDNSPIYCVVIFYLVDYMSHRKNRTQAMSVPKF